MSSFINSGYYNHVFLKRLYNSKKVSKTVFGVLALYVNNNLQCSLKIYKIGEEEIADIPIEGSVHSSTYNIKFLDELINKLSKKYNAIQENLQNTENKPKFILPALINWLDTGSEKVYLIYTRICNEKPWILASSHPYVNKKDGKIKIGFLIILPESIAKSIELFCFNDREKSLTIEFSSNKTLVGDEK